MSTTHSKITELAVASAIGTWVPVANYRQVAVFASEDTAEVQLRKATAVGGTNAANWGTAGTGGAAEYTSTLGDLAGVAYTHVSAIVTDAGSPADAEAVLLRLDGRFSV